MAKVWGGPPERVNGAGARICDGSADDSEHPLPDGCPGHDAVEGVRTYRISTDRSPSHRHGHDERGRMDPSALQMPPVKVLYMS